MISNALREEVLRLAVELKDVLKEDVSLDDLRHGRGLVERLTSQHALFNENTFPVPRGKSLEDMYCLYQENGGAYSIYVSIARKGMSYRPHDHGNSWAIVSGILGYEKNVLYEPISSSEGPISFMPKVNKEIILKPGTSVILRKNDIHSIHAFDDKPLMALHVYRYGLGFQNGRREFDADNLRCVVVNNTQPIIDYNLCS